MADPLLQEMLDMAQQLARIASDIALAGQGSYQAHRKADNSVVTTADLAIQAQVLDAIVQAYPDHALWAEESDGHLANSPSPMEARYCWVVDPLDGTRNYTEGFPCFTISIGVLDRGVPVVGVVREHNLGLTFAAIRGEGTTLNDQAVSVKEHPAGEEMLVAIPTSKDPLAVGVNRRWAAIGGLVPRNLGSTAMHLGLVASGTLGAVFSKRAKIWDVAAGTLLVTEAGGTVTDPWGKGLAPFDLGANHDEDLPFLAAGSQTHQHLLESVRPD